MASRLRFDLPNKYKNQKQTTIKHSLSIFNLNANKKNLYSLITHNLM